MGRREPVSVRLTLLIVLSLLAATPSTAQPSPTVELKEIPEWFQFDVISGIWGVRPKITVPDDPGGLVWLHSEVWQAAAATGRPVEILGRCWSACTMVMTVIPQDRICFGPNAQLGFHAAWDRGTGKRSASATKWMFDRYPKDIQNWITKRGGVGKMSIGEFWYLTAPELWKMGYPRCEDLTKQ